ncbi:FtsX-like permease family protein [Streptomyces sp. NPDC059866]|uniref:FtsX-like permease family protein n=1 Tax=Streptomyces sp. NPDC059866 TaxID=3346978 RepID=UPI0036615461
MLRLALLTLRARAGGFVGTFVALLLGSVVVTACGILMESGLRSTVHPERYAAADVVVAGRQQVATVDRDEGQDREKRGAPVDQTLVERVPVRSGLAERIASIDGVARVTADIGVPAQVIGRDGHPLPGANGAPVTGHNWSATQLGSYRLTAGRAPRGDRQVVLDAGLAERAGLAVGDTVELMTASAPQTFRVSGVVALEGVPSPRRSTLFFSDDLAERLTPRSGFADALGVRAEPGTGTGELARAIGDALGEPGLVVVSGEDRGQAEFPDVPATGSRLVLLSSALAGNAVLVTVFVSASTLSLAMAHRRRESALVRAVGATPRQVRRMVVAEALATALPAGVLGWPLGVAVVHWMRDRMAAHGFVPVDFQPVIGPLPALAAVMIVALTAYTAALVAARRGTRIRPTEALGEATVEPAGLGRGRAITGAVLVIGAAAVFLTGLSQGGDFATLAGLANSLVLLVVIAGAVLGPLLSRVSMRVLGPLLRMSRVTGYLAAANGTTRPRRLADAVVPLILAVSFACTVVFAETTAQRTAQDQLREGLVADHVLTSAAGVAPEVVEKVRRLDQVEAATGVVRSTVVVAVGGDRLVSLSAQGVDPASLRATIDLGTRAGSTERLGRNGVALSTVAASWLGLGVGDTARLRLGDGTPFTPRVVAVYERGSGFADLTFEHDLLLAHTTARLDQSVLVRAAPGARDLAPALAEAARRYPGTVVQDQLADDARPGQQKANAWVNYLGVGLVVAYTGVTVVNAQAMNTAARRREFALLRLGGTTPAQIMRMVRWESLAVVLSGVGIGTLASVPALVLVALALTGSPWPTVPPTAYLGIAGGTAALTGVAALVPARLLLRTRPVDAIGSGE